VNADRKSCANCVKGLRNKPAQLIKMPGAKKSGAKTSGKTKAAAPAAAAAAPVKVEAPVEEAAAESWDAGVQVDALIAELTAIKSAVSTALGNAREFKKRNERELKTLRKNQAKKKASSGNRKPSGFTKPTGITNELATFLGKPAGIEMARTDVTKEINAYIRTHNLQDKDNGRVIRPDKKLSTLLKLKKDDQLTYFNLQRFMSPHFVKAEASA
jgi:chromatin remodeling complex protein RSC6